MQPNWAEENLQVIRTLMERAGLYRRALAPVMTCVGLLGIVAGLGGRVARLESLNAFLSLWLSVAGVAAAVSLLIVRRQALTAGESFWTPPTRRVGLAIMLPFAAAMAFTLPFLGVAIRQQGSGGSAVASGAVSLWLGFYGCGLAAAGQFMSRGVRTLGVVFTLLGAALFYHLNTVTINRSGVPSLLEEPHFLMGATFGGLHLLAGVYLYFTEKRQLTP